MHMKSLYYSIIVCFLGIITFAACNEKEVPVEEQPSIANTRWASDYNPHTLWIEFTSSSDFLEYMGDAKGNPTTSIEYGTYSYKDEKVTFLTHGSSSPFDYATIVNGSYLNLVYKNGYKRTFKKQ